MSPSSNFTPAVFLLSLLVAGYIYSVFCYRLKYITYREAGHRLYLTSAAVGCIMALLIEALLALIALIAHLAVASPFSTSSLNICLYIYGEKHLILLTILMPVVSILSTVIYNRGSENAKDKNVRRAWEKDDLASLLGAAKDRRKPIAITLDSRKTYIGFVARTTEPNIEHANITILPVYSGYRDKDTLKLIITNSYEDVFDYLLSESEGDFQAEDFYIVLPVGNIVACHIFNDEVYSRLNPSSSVGASA